MATPPPLPYQRLGSGPPRRRGSGWLWLVGVVAGLVISLVEWPLIAGLLSNSFNTQPMIYASVVVTVIILTKVGIGIGADRLFARSGFLPGMILSIALVPLIAIGTVIVICGGMLAHN